ncbi:CopD family protein [Sphingomonas sp. C3-2]|uniref:CopD family protein n=1 Tax=Sphingomonas sp. C3-2 TaxID=3062169 RepID=UPI00294B85CC|nr:CopD family protein [Sphingomonas sp. C3-2]WOK35175.1 CopD family protein [Sphingomonas sp. C3-2]
MMEGFLGNLWLWVKAAHIIFAIFLMAGLFMMPRFFIYHQEAPVGSPEDARWIERERRLKNIILNPSLIVVWVLGIVLALNGGMFSQGWFHAKLLFVLLLSGYHGWTVGYAKKLARGERAFSDKKLRMWNEVPGVAAAVIVILAVVRPF